MIYELRRYHLTSPTNTEPFNEHMSRMVALFDKCDMSVAGAWDGVIAEALPFHTYLLRWRDLGHRQTGWEQFYADPEFWSARERMNERAGGNVVRSHSIEILRPASYSPLT